MKSIMLCFILLSLKIAYPTDILTLINQGTIKVSAGGIENSVHYYKPLYVSISNTITNTIKIEIPAGFIFHPTDSSYQSIVITDQLFAVLNAGQTQTFELFGMCIEPSDRAPHKGIIYAPGLMGDEKLVKLAEYISEKQYFSSTGQAAVWALVQDDDLESITGFDSTEVINLVAFMHDLTGKPIPPKPSIDDYERNLSSQAIKVRVGGELEFDLPRRQMVTWSLFNENGILVRELYNGPLGPGEDMLTFQYDATVYKDPVYYLKLVVDGEIIVEQRIGKPIAEDD